MELTIILRIALVGIVVGLISQILKQQNKEELAHMTSLAGVIVVILWIIPYLSKLYSEIVELYNLFA